MAIKNKAVIPTLVLAGLAVAAILVAGSDSGSGPRTVADLDLTLPGMNPAISAPGGTDADGAIAARGRAVAAPAPWWNAGPPYIDPPDGRNLLLPYAGVGWGPFRLAMDLGSFDLNLNKDKSARRARAFAGIDFRPMPDLTLSLEYRSLARGDPFFALGLGNLDLALDHPFGTQTITVNLRYRL